MDKDYLLHWIGATFIGICLFLSITLWVNIGVNGNITLATINVSKWDVIMSHISAIFTAIAQIITKLIN